MRPGEFFSDCSKECLFVLGLKKIFFVGNEHTVPPENDYVHLCEVAV
jgi:hypothetical protein